MESNRYLGGLGCTTFNSGLPPHNPKPSTERGKRRHAKRSDDEKKRSEKAWNRDRSSNESRYAKRLKENGVYGIFK